MKKLTIILIVPIFIGCGMSPQELEKSTQVKYDGRVDVVEGNITTLANGCISYNTKTSQSSCGCTDEVSHNVVVCGTYQIYKPKN